MDARARFAERLKAAMTSAGYEARPSVLEKEFNSRWWGTGVSFQAARRWLKGMSLPEQDKLQVISEWLGVHPQVLRFGEEAGRDVLQKSASAAPALAPQDRAMIDALLALPTARRKLVGELIRALAVAP